MLDPNRITWWKTKWAPAPVQLSINNRSLPSTVTLFFCPTTSISNGVVEVTLPSGFTSGTDTVVSIAQSVTGGQDTSVDFPL